MKRVRESFAAKLLIALVGTVGCLLALAYVIVHSESNRQVDAAVTSAVARADQQLTDFESLQRQQVSRLGRQLTQSVRTLAALDDAISAGDSGVVAQVVSEQAAVADLSGVLVAFTDTRPRPVLTFLGQQPLPGTDPVQVLPLAHQVLDKGVGDASAYRVLDGTLYTVNTQLIQLAGRTIGTVTFGLPLRNEDAQHVSDLVGAEVCYLVAGTCVAGSTRSRVALTAGLAQAAGHKGPLAMSADGDDWSISAEPLVPGDAAQGYRVIAVPLTAVLAPFHRITDALVFGGGTALLLALLLGILLSRGLTRPVQALVNATHRVGEGDYDTEVRIASRDELGTLARAFNEMTHGLMLKERYRSVLQKVVSRDVADELMSGGVELGGETREASVLFADVRGFTALTEGMEPQAVIALVNECMERLSAAVDAEYGVVDKYVGDELMAVFGAPVRQDDHAERAACAAVRMRQAMQELNARRHERGETPIGVGIGINTGTVVAGNMGASNRLNYTVLGETVNLAARLCSAASAGEILISRRAYERSRNAVRATSVGARRLKGFASEVEVFSVEDATQPLEPRRPSGKGMRAVASAMLLATLLPLLPVRGASAQLALPTLQQLGLGYVSPSGKYQISWSGQLDLELISMSSDQVGLVRGGGTFLSPRVRLATDMFAGRHVYALLQLSADGGEAPTRGLFEGRVEQAYVRVANGAGSFGVQAGLFANPFGTYTGTHLTATDLFVRPPLPYDYRTVISRDIVAPTPTDFQAWRDNPAMFRPTGAPPVWQVPYPWGIEAIGNIGVFSYRAGVVNSAPSSEPDAWHPDAMRFKHPSYVAGLRWSVSPGLSVDGSYDPGPYLDPITTGTLPAGRTFTDYQQEIVSGHIGYARGPVVAGAEYLHDRWEVPNAGDNLTEHGYVLSLQSDLAAGIFAGVRWSFLDFQPWDDVDGGHWTDDWDHDVARYEAAVGYRFARNVGITASLLVDRQRIAHPPRTNLAAVRWWWAF